MSVPLSGLIFLLQISSPMNHSTLLLIGTASLLTLAAQSSAASTPHPAQYPERFLSQASTTVYLNNKCRRVAEGFDTWQVRYRRPFKVASGEQYWFVVGQYGDGASLLCVTRPGYAQGQPLALPQLQSRFIDQISQEGSGSSFLIDHQDGNGREVVMTRYRLILSDPMRPRLSQLKQWRQQG
jgi:hypothetical protein